jgi:hypothetical protein
MMISSIRGDTSSPSGVLGRVMSNAMWEMSVLTKFMGKVMVTAAIMSMLSTSEAMKRVIELFMRLASKELNILFQVCQREDTMILFLVSMLSMSHHMMEELRMLTEEETGRIRMPIIDMGESELLL